MALRSAFIAGPLAAALCFGQQAGGEEHAPAGTRWTVRTSQGFDALCALNLLSGDPYYAKQYPAEAAEFAGSRYASARRAAKNLRRVIKDENGGIVSAFLTLVLSGAADSTLDDVIASARAPALLEKPFRASPFWKPESWDLFLRVRSDVLAALEAMREAGFADDWARHMGDTSGRTATTRAELSRYDVLGEEARLLGRPIHPREIEVILLWYSRPHGIRIQGQRLLTNVGYPISIVLRNAAHEPLHPPYDSTDPHVAAAVARFRRDPLIAGIVRTHDASFGYTTIEGYVEEDAVQALEQIVNERMGAAVPAAKRWSQGDEGMHILAAAIYDLLRETRFPQGTTGFGAWFGDLVARGRLAPNEVERRARAVVGNGPVDLWRARGAAR